MARQDEVLKKARPVCPQCEGNKRFKVPIIRQIQQGYRTMRIVDFEDIDCGRCLGKGHV
jgi:hypothetical protein